MKAKLFGAMAFAAMAATSQGGTPNTTAAGAVSYEVGQGWVTHGVDESSQNRWFAFKEVGTRSYCVEAALGTATYLPLDPNLTLYSDSSGTTVYLTNTDGASEPPQNKGSRVCYISPTAFGSPTPQKWRKKSLGFSRSMCECRAVTSRPCACSA